jgi:hypothetical protein
MQVIPMWIGGSIAAAVTVHLVRPTACNRIGRGPDPDLEAGTLPGEGAATWHGWCKRMNMKSWNLSNSAGAWFFFRSVVGFRANVH